MRVLVILLALNVNSKLVVHGKSGGNSHGAGKKEKIYGG